MRFDFKIDYIGQTAAHYTTFTLTEQSRGLIQSNLNDQTDRADRVSAEIGRRALDKARMQLKGSNVNIFG